LTANNGGKQMSKLNFGVIDRFILFGGGRFLLYAATKLIKEGYEVIVFSSERHLKEDVDGKALIKQLE
jgi:hypothetical protein